MEVHRRKKSVSGFTLVELMIVIAIIGILAAIAIPQFSLYRIRGYNTTARADVKNAYTAAQNLFTHSPGATVTYTDLINSGYRQSPGVTISISTGTLNSITITAAHGTGNITYTVDKNGTISP